MSTAIWDEAPVLACLCVTYCDRCPEGLYPVKCVQLISVRDGGHNEPLQLCAKCFAELTMQIMKLAGV